MIVRPVLCRTFVGRHEELAYLRQRRLDVASSHGAVLLIAGDAGIGKSRLISEFCDSLAYSRWRVGRGNCLEFGARPYGPILEALAQLDPQPFDVAAAATKDEQFEAIANRFAAVAARTGLVVVVEDVHWADAATLEFLTYFAARIERVRVLLLLSMRSDALYAEHATLVALAKITRTASAGRIDLAALRGPELRTFIDDALSGIALSEKHSRTVILSGEGNPFFTEELLKSAVERQRTAGDSALDKDLPTTLRAMLLERLRPLSETERRIVAQAAVIGRTFNVALLAATLDVRQTEIFETLRRARDFQLIEEASAGVFRFRHALTRQALYETYLGAEVQPRHRAIALALEHESPERRSVEALAYHWWAAGDTERAARYNELAGDAATAIHAHEDAIAFYRRALEAADLDPTLRGKVLEKIGERQVTLTLQQDARASFVAAAASYRDAGSVEREAHCLTQGAIIAYHAGLPEPTTPLESMLERLDAGEYLARSRIHLGLAWLTATFGFPTRSGQHLTQVDRRALSILEIRTRFHNVAAWNAMTVGDLESFRSEHAAWLAAAQETKSPRLILASHVNGASCYISFGCHREASEHLQAGLRVSRDSRDSSGEESCHGLAALYHLMRGELHHARSAMDSVSTSSEHRVNAVLAAGWGLLIGTYLDDDELIDRWFGEVDLTSVRLEPECGAGFAEVLVRRGRAAEAAMLLHRLIPDCEVLRASALTLLAVGRYGSAEDRVRARAHLAHAAEGRDETIERAALPLFDAMECARDGCSSDTASFARGAAEGFRRLGMPLLEAQALELAGDEAGAFLLYRRCGAIHDVRRLEGKRAGIISQREREIALLAAKGTSNHDIARKLSITLKTVEKHLSSVYRKLGVSSRAALNSALSSNQIDHDEHRHSA
ncbi:MAG: AAA family ATPase [Candidatus Eremiobacteraeota bacterium]|nr:AAA family ATPase [Candidatus Eremiobacteraeota bacterium]